jgi:hypothetical protein
LAAGIGIIKGQPFEKTIRFPSEYSRNNVITVFDQHSGDVRWDGGLPLQLAWTSSIPRQPT